MTQSVRDVMTGHPVTVGVLTSVAEAARVMRDADIGDVLVVDGDRLRGIVTDRDLVVRALAEGKDPSDTTVRSVCSDRPVTVGPDEGVDRAVGLMREHALRRLPVTEEGRVVGIVTLGDLAIEKDPTSALADISSAEATP